MPESKTLRSSASATAKAQLSMVEHALCPLDTRVSLNKGFIYESSYSYTDQNRNRKQAIVQVGCVEGLSSTDELYLWGILGLALSGREPANDFYATPYWILRQLGKITNAKKGSEEFRLFRDSIKRLAGVRYQNSAFYDPIRSEHRQVSFGLLNYSLPMDEKSARAWRFAFDPIFWELISVNRSSLKFDMELYASLSPAARRLYLFLKKQFWRNTTTGKLNLRQTAVSVLGFSDSLETKVIRSKLSRALQELLDNEIIRLGDNQRSVKDCFSKIGVGEYSLILHRGAAYDRASELGSNRPEDSPLFDPLLSIGFDRSSIVRLIAKHKPALLSQWVDITLAAMERGLIDKSPQAYFTYYIEKKSTPPDWWHELRREERRQEADQQRARLGLDVKLSEERGFDDYLHSEAKDAFDRVMRSLTADFLKTGKAQQEAEQVAREHAMRHFRNKYRKEKNPSFDRI